MTPKEKAKKLVDKFYSEITGMELSFVSKLIVLPNGDSNYKTAKQCALIVVDEIIKELPILDYHPLGSYTNPRIKYWQEVKQEIEKL